MRVAAALGILLPLLLSGCFSSPPPPATLQPWQALPCDPTEATHVGRTVRLVEGLRDPVRLAHRVAAWRGDELVGEPNATTSTPTSEPGAPQAEPSVSREWTTNVIADRLLHDAIRTFEESQQPQVLREASNAFDAMTAGAYHQLIVPDGAEEIIALGRDGREVTVMEMSRGTREQAYLALRIGLIRAFGQRVRALPVLVDDILVNFDPERATEAMRALDGLSSDHQVFIFTCHPSTVALARFISPGARIISLGEQKVTNLTPIWLDND